MFDANYIELFLRQLKIRNHFVIPQQKLIMKQNDLSAKRVSSLKYSIAFLMVAAAIASAFYFYDFSTTKNKAQLTGSEQLRAEYADFLQNHPFGKNGKLSKKKLHDLGLPPNKQYLHEYLLTSNPATKRPYPEKILELQQELRNNGQLRAPIGTGINNWQERGPNNIGGRTRALIFAPGSSTKVIAGGVSGGLWINNNITNAFSEWQRVTGVPENMAVSSITVDPLTPTTMYIGTGEVYTAGIVNGNGVYKSVDGGNNWTHIYGPTSGPVEDRIAFIQDIIAWVNPVTGTTEILFASDSSFYKESLGNYVFLGQNTIGVYKSTDGTNFNRITDAVLQQTPGNYYAPNTFDVNSNSTKVWMGTKPDGNVGTGGGTVFSYDGSTWANIVDLNTGGRVEIVCSKQNANKIYMLCEDNISATQKVQIFRTTNAFATQATALPIPVDIDPGTPANDFTRGQSFYDLQIGVDPLNDATLWVGGIDIFRSTNSGDVWVQKTHWFNSTYGLPIVHSDHHSIAFNSSNRIVFGNDGGVYFSDDGGTNFGVRNKGYNVTQYYKGDINQGAGSVKLMAGAQDNGVQLMDNAQSGINPGATISGGDGGWVFFDKDSQYLITSYTNNQYYVHDINGVKKNDFDGNTGADGSFINECGLNSSTNHFYSNKSTGAPFGIYRWTIDPVAFTATNRTTLTNGLLTSQPTFFIDSPFVADRMLVGTATGSIIQMDNASTGSPTWTNKSIPGMVGAVSDIRYGQTVNDIMVTFHNYGVVSVWTTTNGGTSWVSKEGNLPDMPVKAILQNPLNLDEVMLGTELGIWTTSNWNDATPTWAQSQNGMSNVKVMNLTYRAVDNTVLAATHGRGMFTGTFESNNVYCTSNGTTVATGVTNVTMNTINNSDTDNTNAGYEDFSTQITELRQGKNYDLSVKVNTNGANTVNVKAWIDWNNNGDFTDAGEEYDLGTANNVANGASTLSPLSITVSPTTLFGNKRLRISAKNSAAPTSCETGFDGEVEDYTVKVISPIFYCPAGGTQNSTDYIANVTLGAINNTTGPETNGYGDYTALTPAILTANSTESISVTKGGGDDEYVGVWIDYNGDGDFDDADEVIGLSPHSTVPTITLPFTVPANVTAINTRMRVIVQYKNDPPMVCGTVNYRDVEDYTVTLVPASLCGGATKTWTAGAWSPVGAPNDSNAVIIASTYDTAVNGNLDVCSITVNSGVELMVKNASFAKVKTDITVNGTLTVENTGSVVQVNDDAVVNKGASGVINVKKTTPSLGVGGFMIMGSPMTAETRTGVFGSSIMVRNHITTNFVLHPGVEAISPGLNNWADDDGNNWINYTGTINPAEGYLVRPYATQGGSGVTNLVFTQGTLNNGIIYRDVIKNATGINSSPNMVGNPYASAISANQFLTDNAAFADAVYFWEHLTAPSIGYPGYQVSNWSMGDISMYNSMGGVAAANGGAVPSGFIASGQGFGFKAKLSGLGTNGLKFNNAMRVTGNNDTYHRQAFDKDRIWLSVTNETYNLGSNILIGFSDVSTDGFDNQFDTQRMPTPVSFYSKLNTGEELAIQGRSAFNEDQEIQLGFSTQVETMEKYTISLANFDGANLNGVTVYLKDKVLNTITNLSEGNYSFFVKAGNNDNRFVVIFRNPELSVGDFNVGNVSVVPNPTNGMVSLISPKAAITAVEVYDIRGRRINDVTLNLQGEYLLDLSRLQSAVYFVKIKTDKGDVTKRIIKN